MAHSQSALKRWRQNERRRARNKSVRTATRTAVKKARVAIAGDGDAQAEIREAMSVLDRAAKKHVIHANAASRHKARLMVHLNEAGGGTAAEAPKRGARKSPAKKTSAKGAKKTGTKAATKVATKAAAAKRAAKK